MTIRRPRRAHATRRTAIYLPPDADELAAANQRYSEDRAERIAQERARIPAGKIVHHGKVVLSDHFMIGNDHYYKAGIHREAWFIEMRARNQEAQP